VTKTCYDPAWDWLAFDRNHVWHPYAAVPNSLPPLPVTSAAGVHLRLEDGRELIDGMASWWSVIHGYNHPRLNDALHRQLERMAHVMFGGLTHRSAVELAATLVDVTPEPLEQVFFCDSGSVAVEVAIKMALQYWQARREPQRQRLLTVRSGYHGDTFGAMSVCDPVTGMHSLFSGVLAQQLFAEAPDCAEGEPWDDTRIAGLQGLLEQHRDEIAAVILEPLVQGAGGMRVYCAEYLRQARLLCDAHGVLLILDEIATGFGRTGSLFACEQAGISPDILCLGKALTGGYMSLAATLATPAVSEAICAAEPGLFMHGPTFMANPLACAVALESVRLLLESPWRQRVTHIEEVLRGELEPCRDLVQVRDVRIKGAIGVLEMERPVDMAAFTRGCVERGVWLRPFNRLIYTMPAYVISDPDLRRVAQAMRELAAGARSYP
jgi:adenosylmethionine-8-amino-7-oxononanoate aminotransferase